MIDKFQKLFGPNPPRSDVAIADIAFGSESDDQERRQQMARIKNKRRILGLLALLAAVLVFAPWILQPNDRFAEPGARTEIPALQQSKLAAHIALDKKSVSVQNPEVAVRPSSLGPGGSTASSSLSMDNPVAASVVPSPREPGKGVSVTTPVPAAGPAASVERKPLSKDVTLRTSARGQYIIQVIATSNRSAAETQARRIKKLGLPAYTESVRRRGTDLWRVRVGRFVHEDDARAALDVLALNAIPNGGVKSEPVGRSKK